MINKKFTMLSLTLLALSACSDDNAASMGQHAKGAPARVDTPELRSITDYDEFTGRFQAINRVELKARVGGYLDAIKFIDGQLVKKGDVLFVIDQRPFKIAQERAMSKFELAEKEYLRAKKLIASNTISEADYDQRSQKMKSAKTELDDAKLNLEFTEIIAPFNGRMSRNLVDIGGLIDANMTLLSTLVSTDKIEFYFDGSENDFLKFTRNIGRQDSNSIENDTSTVAVKLQDETEFMHKGRINFLNNELDKETGTIQIRAEFNNEDHILEPGMFGRIKVSSIKPENKLVIPDAIIGTEMTRKYVYVLDQDNKAMRKYITLGKLTNDGKRIVLEGLTIEDKVIVGNLHMVQPGGLISPIPTEKTANKEGNK